MEAWTMEDWMAVLIVALASLAVLALVAGWLNRNRRHKRSAYLRDKFGPEYDRMLEEGGSRLKAEADLEARARPVERLALHPLPERDYERFSEIWDSTQKMFLDSPVSAVSEADRLVKDVMHARGYPVADFDRRAEDISVEHPHLVSDYRKARDIAVASRQGNARTEELRKAMVLYRRLFEDLLVASVPYPEARRA